MNFLIKRMLPVLLVFFVGCEKKRNETAVIIENTTEVITSQDLKAYKKEKTARIQSALLSVIDQEGNRLSLTDELRLDTDDGYEATLFFVTSATCNGCDSYLETLRLFAKSRKKLRLVVLDCLKTPNRTLITRVADRGMIERHCETPIVFAFLKDKLVHVYEGAVPTEMLRHDLKGAK